MGWFVAAGIILFLFLTFSIVRIADEDDDEWERDIKSYYDKESSDD